MEKVRLILLALTIFCFACQKEDKPKLDSITIQDQGFLDALLKSGIDTDGDGIISMSEAAVVNKLVIIERVKDMTGIEWFINLDTLICSYPEPADPHMPSEDDYRLQALDVSNNTKLIYLDCANNAIGSLDITNNINLRFLSCGGNYFVSLDLTPLRDLEYIDVSMSSSSAYYGHYGSLQSLLLASHGQLRTLVCSNNRLKEIDPSGCPELIYLQCGGNIDSDLDLTHNTKLEQLCCNAPDPNIGISTQGKLAALDIYNCTALRLLRCDFNSISSLDLSNNVLLASLSCKDNYIQDLDVSRNTSLVYLNCGENQIKTLDVSNCDSLEYLDCYFNQLEELNVSGCSSLTLLRCSWNQLSKLNISINSLLTDLDISYMFALHEVCVWTVPFPPNDVYVFSYSSPNVYFTIICSK